ncbi:hypothetical protein J2X36_004189 [Methylobacterium sp. BE186]|uniref:hypothetical protein n=1 Tax=Methylobacterium sp. BE186 TaxID=2817715 RepID=UPI00285CC14F|nr:hypothetical protein [Methylobacterium sp. BE186]MDR7039413.1 hypothetical protein [Methylobacterium sp. BE186]
MDQRREKLLASKSAAMKAKAAFMAQYIEGHADRAAGLGVSKSGEAWAFVVFVHTPDAAAELPDHFGAFDVEVQVTGPARAY